MTFSNVWQNKKCTYINIPVVLKARGEPPPGTPTPLPGRYLYKCFDRVPRMEINLKMGGCPPALRWGAILALAMAIGWNMGSGTVSVATACRRSTPIQWHAG